MKTLITIPAMVIVAASSNCIRVVTLIYVIIVTVVLRMGVTPIRIRDPAITNNEVSRPIDPVILPIPPSGNERNPYFANLTRVRKFSKKSIQNAGTFGASYDKHHRGYYLVTTNYPWSVVYPNNSHANQTSVDTDVSWSSNGNTLSPFLQTTSEQSEQFQCNVAATNGGPFDKGGRWNSGPTVVNGSLVWTKSHAEKSQFVGFGIGTQKKLGNSKEPSSNRYWVMGRYGQLVQSSVVTLWDFVTGFEWLVYDGKPCVTHTNPTGAIRAPRTTIGLDKDSNLMLLVVDGCELCLSQKGLTLEELANVLVDLGAVYAVNMDGGGSSTMVMPFEFDTSDTNNSYDNDYSNADVHNGHRKYAVINHPTCLDLPFPYCQRAVSTVLCVSKNHTQA